MKPRAAPAPVFVSGDTAAAKPRLPLNVFCVRKNGKAYYYFQKGRTLPKDQRGPLVRIYGEPGSVQFEECVAAADTRSRIQSRGRKPKVEGAFVYFLVVGETLKVGYSKDPLSRLEALQTGLARQITSLTCVPGSRQMERRCHEYLDRDRLQGEWFRLSMRALKLIAAAAAGQPLPGAEE